jgi:hypothetical protein
MNEIVQKAFGTPTGLADGFGFQKHDPTGITQIHPRSRWVPRACGLGENDMFEVDFAKAPCSRQKRPLFNGCYFITVDFIWVRNLIDCWLRQLAKSMR